MYPELQYVEIIATTGSSGSDQNVQERGNGEEEELASTITVLASPEQSRLLAELEQTGKLHAALVFRGESTQAQKFLDEQASVLKELYPEETEDPKKDRDESGGTDDLGEWANPELEPAGDAVVENEQQ